MALSKIGSAGLASGAVEAADIADGAVTSAKLANPNVFMGRNRIINGAMMIDQRNAGAAVTTDNTYPVDRFLIRNFTSGSFSAQQDSSAPTGFVNSIKVTTTTADASITSNEFLIIQQRIEGRNVSDLAWGSASAKTITLSFWVRSSLTGTFGGSLENSAGNRAYPFQYTISSADTWEQKSITVAGDTSGTWLTTTGIGIRIIWGLGVGSTYSGTANAWAGADYFAPTGAVAPISTLNATWYITGVQLEVGSTATDFERRQYGQEFVLCQRYFVRKNGYSHATAAVICPFMIAYSTTAMQGSGVLPVEMRASPTISKSGTLTAEDGVNAFTTTSGFSGVQSTTFGYNFWLGGFTGLTQYRGYYTGVPSGSYFDFSAEL